jgi:23S rRNA pseudouridine2605 synthase
MIVAGRVMVNGQLVTQLGSKADPTHDHIRVDGKLLRGAERHRYFVLNKPKGYVTTVSDPEGRPTVMEFFAKTKERLYPVGRLDYLSEGLLLMTNDGELANLVTKAGSGVEKTYLVKVAGQPSDEEMERLRGGVAIERDEAGSERVRTAPARIRKVREGENPWYEVVLTEGRNRELRKMFAAIGHFAEKIRRVGYGPLVLDVEPGKLRELTETEVTALRMTAEGKMKPRRIRMDLVLPKEAGRAAEKRDKFVDRRDRGAVRRDAGGQRQFGRAEGRFDQAPARGGKPFRKPDERGQRTEWKPREREFGSAREGGAARSGERPSFDKRRAKPFGARPEFGSREGSEPLRSEEKVGFGERGGRPPRASSDFSKRPSKPFGARPGFGGRPKFGGRSPGQAAGRFENAPRKPFRAEGGKPRWQREDRGGKKEGRPQRREFGGAAKGGDAFRRGLRPEQAGIHQPGIRIDRVERPPFKPQGERPAFGAGVEAKRPFEGGGGKGFDKGAKFGAKPGGFAKFRGKSGGGKKFGGSRPGAARGGWTRGSTRKPQS